MAEGCGAPGDVPWAAAKQTPVARNAAHASARNEGEDRRIMSLVQ
jgi:hypothetical protein